MKEENKKKIDNLIINLKTETSTILQAITEMYIDSDKSGGFIDPGESVEPDYENTNAMNKHIALFKTVEGEINYFIIQIEEALENINFVPESVWIKDKEKKTEDFISRLKGLL